MSAWKLFELDTGCTEWIIAKDEKEALDHYRTICDLSDEDIEGVEISEVSEERLDKLVFTEEDYKTKKSFREEFERSIKQEKLPYMMASTEF